MATAKEHLFVSVQPDKLVLLAEIPAAGSSGAEPAVTFRLLVEQSYDYGAGQDVDTMEDVTCRVPLRDMNCRGAVGRAFGELLAGLDNPMLHPEIAPEAEKAAARVRARCGDGDCVDELGGVEFRLRVMLIDALDEPVPEEDYESGSDMEFGEFDLHGARKVHDQSAASFYEEDDDDDEDDGCGAQFSARPYHGPSDGTLLLSGFEARSDGPEITDQHELTSWDVQRLVHMALNGGGGNMEDDEAYQRALAGGNPLSQASRAAILRQALQSTGHPQQQISKSPIPMFPMRTGF